MTRPIRPIRIEGDVAYVTLTKGYEAIIDAADVPLVEGFNWSAFVNKDRRTVYAVRGGRYGPKRLLIRMHRVIMNTPSEMKTDHIDGNGLNNRRTNLRVATNSENMRNRGAPTNNTSGFKGVSAVSNGKWSAKIKLKYKLYYIGSFDTPEAAHAAYVAASELLHGEFARAA
jgi:hypothetical protein